MAAPTAGLHFTDAVFARLRERGVETRPVTLHVGAGTFQPVKSDEIGGHPMHTETFSVSIGLVEALVGSLAQGRPTLESLPYIGRHLLDGDGSLHVTQWEAYEADETVDLREDTLRSLQAIADHMDAHALGSLTASTSIMIAPGFRWRIVDRMVTNFHQPQGTLLLLVSSFLGDGGCGRQRWREIYDEALAGDYRFLSYGDACLFTRKH